MISNFSVILQVARGSAYKTLNAVQEPELENVDEAMSEVNTELFEHGHADKNVPLNNNNITVRGKTQQQGVHTGSEHSGRTIRRRRARQL